MVLSPLRDVPYRGELKITTGRYYIPSGRCIQAHEYNHDGSTKSIPDSLRSTFYTKAGRPVTDGGGIQPDSLIPNDTLPTMVYDLVQSDVFFDWGTDFASAHPTIAPPGEFHITDSMYADFCAYVEESDFKNNRRSDEVMELLRKVAEMEGYLEDAKDEMAALEAKFAPDTKKDLERMKKHIIPYLEGEAVIRYYRQNGSIRHAMPKDKVYRCAVNLLRDHQAYKNILSKKEK